MPGNAATAKIDARSSADRKAIKPGLSRQRSRLSNHRDLLPQLDGRSAAARRFRDLVNAFCSDAGGIDACSEVKLGLIRRLASVTVQSEMLEAKMVGGEAVDVATLCTLASTVVRLSQRLGLNRIPKSVTPSVGEYLLSKHGAPA